MTPSHRLAIIVAVVASLGCTVLLVLLLTRGSHQARGDASGKRTAPDQPASLQLRRTKLGQILTDEHGLTLYLFDEDKGGKSSCFTGCAKVWPPALVAGRPRAGQGVSAAKLTTIPRGSRRQLVYDGHPLYRLDADSQPGQTQGEGFGGTWWMVSPAGQAVIAPGLKRSKGGY
jgi:predicted lipoprotein with Yx(FWY)xxD motif